MRHSAHFEEIDVVIGCREIATLGNVKEAGSTVSEREKATSKGDCIKKKEDRTLRKKTKKREREEEKENKDRKMFHAAFTGLET